MIFLYRLKISIKTLWRTLSLRKYCCFSRVCLSDTVLQLKFYWIKLHYIEMLLSLGINSEQGSWIKRDQLDVTCFFISLFNAQHVSDVNTPILRSLRLIGWVISWVVLLWFDMCWCYVVVWLGWCGILRQASACIRIPHHPSQTTT